MNWPYRYEAPQIRGIPALLLSIGLAGWFVALGVLKRLGGGAGPIEGGVHFLNSHGKLTRVSESVYAVARWIELSLPLIWLVGAGGAFLCLYGSSVRPSWYMRSRDLKWVAILLMASGFVGSFFMWMGAGRID